MLFDEDIFLSLIVFLACLAIYFYKKIGKAYGIAAQFAPNARLRRALGRKAVLAGDREGRKLYAISKAHDISAHCPLQKFQFKKVHCVFTDYYFASRYHSLLDKDQKNFCMDLLAFKDGKRSGIDYFKNGVKILKPEAGTIVMFMPCSAQWKYWKRFKKIADYVRYECPELVSGIAYIKYSGERESLHLTKGRVHVQVQKNYYINIGLKGKKILLVDDVITTGGSLECFRKEIERNDGIVVGAIFAAETFRMPGAFSVFFHALFQKESEIEDEVSKNDKTSIITDKQTLSKEKARSRNDLTNSLEEEEFEDDDWMPDRVVADGDGITFYYEEVRDGRPVIVKKEHFPPD